MKSALLANGRKIAYYTDGPREGLPLVLLHGFCEDASIWAEPMRQWKDLPVIRIDLPRFGASDLPITPGMEGYADAVCAVLNDLSIARAVIIGHSMGGYTALSMAATQPERLAGLGLVHSHPFADAPERIENRRRGITMLEEGKRDLYVAQLFPGLFAPNFATEHPEIVQAVIEQGKKQPAAGIIAALQGMIERREHLDTLGQLQCPVLFLLGAEDALIPRTWMQEMIHLPHLADIHLLPATGHMSMLEAPDQCAAIIREFYELCLQT